MEKDNVKKEGKWVFDEEVTNCFSNMLERSIPNYNTMRDLCYIVGRNFIKDNGKVSDIGCSNGLASEKFINEHPNTQFILSDVSEPMLNACRERYKDNNNVTILEHDLRNGMASQNNNLVIASLTLQFTPIEYRWHILQSIYDSLSDGGALILVEKVLGSTANIDKLLVDEYYNIKRENGYTNELIESKRKSLEGVLVPLTCDFNEHLMRMCGFKEIDCFWRFLNFVGYIAIK